MKDGSEALEALLNCLHESSTSDCANNTCIAYSSFGFDVSIPICQVSSPGISSFLHSSTMLLQNQYEKQKYAYFQFSFYTLFESLLFV